MSTIPVLSDSICSTTVRTYSLVWDASLPKARALIKSFGSVDTSHTGAKLTFTPMDASNSSFSFVSLVIRSNPPSLYSDCGEWKGTARKFGLELMRTTVPPSSSTPISMGVAAAS